MRWAGRKGVARLAQAERRPKWCVGREEEWGYTGSGSSARVTKEASVEPQPPRGFKDMDPRQPHRVGENRKWLFKKEKTGPLGVDDHSASGSDRAEWVVSKLRDLAVFPREGGE